MKEIALKELTKVIDEYCNRNHRQKPLMIWFNSNANLDNFKKELCANKCITTIIGDRTMPIHVNPNSSILLCHRYVAQMDENALRYCLDVFNQHKMPLIYLANDYKITDKPNLVEDNFEQVRIVYGTPKDVVLISCGKSQKGIWLAHELYKSQLFQKSWEYANSLKPDCIFILSTKYELLDPYLTVQDYDEVTPTGGWKQWADNIKKQLRENGIDLNTDNITILAGEKYCKYLRNCITHFNEPLKGLKFGHRQQMLNKLISK